MDFPITDLLDDQQSQRWLEAYFHPDGLHCPDCGASPAAAYRFRRTQCSRLQVYRCRHCGKTYNLYTGTVFAHRQLSAPQVVMLLRGIFQGESSAQLSRELALSRTTVLKIRRAIQDQAAAGQIISPLADEQSETDEMFQNAGEKGEPHRDPEDPPRRRANKRRGHGTYEHDRPPIMGTVGRTSGEVRLQVVQRTDSDTLTQHIEAATLPQSHLYTDEWRGYNSVPRSRQSVCHGQGEWARDEDGDGIREVHTNTIEGLWTSLRNFLRPFRGVHKRYLAGYVAICELQLNLHRVTPDCVAQLVARPSFAH